MYPPQLFILYYLFIVLPFLVVCEFLDSSTGYISKFYIDVYKI